MKLPGICRHLGLLPVSLLAATATPAPSPAPTAAVTPAAPAEFEALVSRLMGLGADERAVFAPLPPSPRTGFFFAQPYDPNFAVPADAVQLYAGLESTAPAAGLGQTATNAQTVTSWVQRGYAAQLFLHSRYGADLRQVAAEDQTDREGRAISVIGTFVGDRQVDLAVGPLTPELVAAMHLKHGASAEVRRVDRYMIPTRERIALATRYYANALAGGEVSAFCFDEPEIWVAAGYSDAFKSEWQEHYGSPWRPPHADVTTRYQAEQLKARLIERWVGSVLRDVRARRPGLTTLLALHSQTNYAGMGMEAPHHRLFSLPELDEVVAEVWNDPFDSCYLQYSSFHHQLRGTGKKLWLMMDPWGDSPALSLDYYRRSYGSNVLAALMFPSEERYQPLIWPNRLYGKVPPAYATLINSVAGMLADLWQDRAGQLEAGSPGLATFVADSMAWQRAEPAPSDFDGFLGLGTPLVQRGLPVDVLPLERVAEPGYLANTRCALLSYDLLKPTAAAQSGALADWVRAGGTLIFFGGGDAYDAVADAWWRRAGHASALAALLADLHLPAATPRTLQEPGVSVVLDPNSGALGPDASTVTVPTGPHPGELQLQQRTNFWQSETSAAPPPRTYPVTYLPPPPGAVTLYQDHTGAGAVAWECAVGRGHFIFVGVAPGFLGNAPEGAGWLRRLARHGLERSGNVYREAGAFVLRRGSLVAVRTLTAATTIPGHYVDLLGADLPGVVDPVIPPDTSALLVAAPTPNGAPVVSGRLVAWHASAQRTAFLVRAPTATPGIARIGRGDQAPATVQACNLRGEVVPVTSRADGDALLLSYPNDAEGVIVRVDWN